jgi:hypothetical protein
MSQKKINGYVIFMKDILGKGSYGCVPSKLHRFIEDSKTTQNSNAQLKCSKKNSVFLY